jgi:cytochrome c553
MMTIVARSLSDQQIADLAAWYSGHSVTVTLTADPSAAPADCVACHGADGLHLLPEAPNLAGEANIYIDTQLKAFRNGKRTHEIMSPIAAEMTDADIRAVADWYAAVQLEIELVE